ncbi:MAG TPA: hypothetical protein VK475_06280 [Pyrinomonadaceae bacterium]|nr:hypothetical protein [Pyrinomonadaceae bacterium]
MGNITITMQPGQCKASLNGVDIGCPSGAVHSRLENGRHIVNFPATDVASIGFAGQRIETTGNLSSTMWVDGAYINQQRFDADGQCTFERKTQGHVELSCKAILRDGRKLSGYLDNSEQKDSFLGVETETTNRAKCERVIEVHGMLTRAQFQCNFSKYNTILIDESRRCSPVVGEGNVEDLLRDSMALFDKNEKERGRKALCRSILSEFPNFVRR